MYTLWPLRQEGAGFRLSAVGTCRDLVIIYMFIMVLELFLAPWHDGCLRFVSAFAAITEHSVANAP